MHHSSYGSNKSLSSDPSNGTNITVPYFRFVKASSKEVPDFLQPPEIQLISTTSACSSSWTINTTLQSACSASHGTARKALSSYDISLRSLKPLCTPSRT
eukprot:2704487-Pleurochrysis_carterae.AAC.1